MALLIVPLFTRGRFTAPGPLMRGVADSEPRHQSGSEEIPSIAFGHEWTIRRHVAFYMSIPVQKSSVVYGATASAGQGALHPTHSSGYRTGREYSARMPHGAGGSRPQTTQRHRA